MKNLRIELLREVEPQKVIDFTFTRQNDIGKIGAVQDAVLVLFEMDRVQVESERQAGPEAVAGVELQVRVIVQQSHESPEFQPAHVRNVGRQIGEAVEDFSEMVVTHVSIAPRAIADVQKEAFVSGHHHFVKGKQALVLGIDVLHHEMQLDAHNPRMIEHAFGITQCIGVVRMIGGKAVKVPVGFKQLDVPPVHGGGEAGFVGIVGINDRADILPLQIVDASGGVVFILHLRTVSAKELPYGVESLVRKEVNVEVDDGGWEFVHGAELRMVEVFRSVRSYFAVTGIAA
jgi:hypothetical protein